MTPWQRAEIVHAVETVFGPHESRELVNALPPADGPRQCPMRLRNVVVVDNVALEVRRVDCQCTLNEGHLSGHTFAEVRSRG